MSGLVHDRAVSHRVTLRNRYNQGPDTPDQPFALSRRGSSSRPFPHVKGSTETLEEISETPVPIAFRVEPSFYQTKLRRWTGSGHGDPPSRTVAGVGQPRFDLWRAFRHVRSDETQLTVKLRLVNRRCYAVSQALSRRGGVMDYGERREPCRFDQG
jgi:hypothetical protein